MRRPILRIRETVPLPLSWALGLIPPLLLVSTWWFLTRPRELDKQGKPVVESRIISPVILPSPRETIESIPVLWLDRELSRSTVDSLKRVAGGYVIAVVVALPLGVLMGSFTKIKALFNPLTVVGTYLPLPAVGILILALSSELAKRLPGHVATSELYKYLYLAVVTFVVLLPQVVAAIENVDHVYLQTAYTQGAGRWQAIWKVLIPVSLPNIFTALRTSFAVGWTYIILAEIFAADRGLGYIIFTSQRRSIMEHIYLTVLVIMLIGFLIDKVWAAVGRWLLPYQTAR